MNFISRTITGILLITLGLVLVIVSVYAGLIFTLYGTVILILGVFIFFNKNEDKIEQRKDMKGGKK